jgi:alpha-1,6-mannosyltransferase
MERLIQSDAPRAPFALLRSAPGWVSLGAGGAVLLTVSGARLGGGSVTWWFHPRVLAGTGTKVVFYAGIAALALAWLGLGRVLLRQRFAAGQLWPVAVIWCLPLVLGAPLFSRDVYSYLAQGTIAHLGLSPYTHAPVVLGRLGHAHVLNAVDPFWRSATAPYGPLFLGAISAAVGLTGSHLIAGALAIRAIELIGLVLLGVFVPRLARAAGADPVRALWLTLLSPLVLLQLVAAGHNDLLMVGVMVVGVTLALEGRPLWAVATCTLAATIKVPAIAAVAFVAFAWARAEPDWPTRIARAAKAIAVSIAVGAAVTLITGFGIGWVSSALFSTPAQVHLAITPATDLSWTAASLLRDLGASVSFRAIQSVLRVVAFGASIVVGIALLLRTRRETLPRNLGLALIAFALGGPAAWPWYLCWGLVMLAVWRRAQASRVLVAGILVATVLVKPAGTLALPIASSPVIAALWVVVAAGAWYAWIRPGVRGRRAELSEGLGPARSVLVEH